MHGFQIFEEELFADRDYDANAHVPLDWNEDLTLEEYLERVKANSEKFLNQ